MKDHEPYWEDQDGNTGEVTLADMRNTLQRFGEFDLADWVFQSELERKNRE